MKTGLFVILILMLSQAYAETWDEVAKITAANLKGHTILYKEGFYVITSTEKAIDYFVENTVQTAGDVWNEVLKSSSDDTHKFYKDLMNNPELAKKVYKNLERARRDAAKGIKKGTKQLIKEEKELAKSSFKDSWGSILKGTILIKERTAADRNKLMNIPKGYFKNLKNDFSNLKQILSILKSRKKEKADEIIWKESFAKASDEFNKEYEKSGKKVNSLSGLTNILWGHVKAIYYGFIKPSGKSVRKTVELSGTLLKKGIEKLILLPVGAVAVISGRTLYSVGGVVYYSTMMGVDIISPYLESSYHTAVGLVSAASIAPTYIAVKTLGVAGQVALKAASVVGAGATYSVATLGDSAQYLGNIFYDVGKGTGKVVIGATSSAVVLGYNAITALPTHLVMGTVNSIFFLIYDGPRLSLTCPAWYNCMGRLSIIM